jgi:hypothetical protein
VTNKNSSFGFNKQKTSKDWISWDLVNKNWWFYFISQTTNRWFHGISSHHGGSPLLEKTRPTYAPGLGKLDAKGSRARAALEPRGSGFNGFRDFYTDLLLVGGWPTPLKNDGVKVSWDYDIPNLWKNIKMIPNIWKTCSTPPTSYRFGYLPFKIDM